MDLGLLSLVIASSLAFGSQARVSIIGADEASTPERLKRERKLSVGLFGALFVISWWLTRVSDSGLEGAALIAVGTGAAGPIAITWLVEKLFGKSDKSSGD